MREGIMFGSKHTYTDFGLKLLGIQIGLPIPQTYPVEVPGRDGVLDLSEAVCRAVKYFNRELIFTFDRADQSYESWTNSVRRISNYMQGKKMQVIMDMEPDYFYTGRCICETEKENKIISGLTITLDAEPYKQEVVSSLDEWEWDNFNFETGVIRELKNIAISSSKNYVDVIGGEVEVVLEFIVTNISTPLSAVFQGKSYSLKIGKNRYPQIKIGADITTRINFTGTGTVSIEYRGRSL